MPQENQSELFIRLLAEALEADRVIKRAGYRARSRAGAARFKQLFRSDLIHAMHTLEPMDRLHNPMVSRSQDMRMG